jgi:5-methylcytosine-specific restriction endonuclease McrA
VARHSPFYAAYMKSEAWRAKRKVVLFRAGNRCQRCGERKGLQVHHLTYDRLGRESLSDLICLCKNCHKIADVVRSALKRKA